MEDILNNFEDLESLMDYIEIHYALYSKRELASVLVSLISSLDYSLQSGEDSEALLQLVKDNYEEV